MEGQRRLDRNPTTDTSLYQVKQQLQSSCKMNRFFVVVFVVLYPTTGVVVGAGGVSLQSKAYV